MFLKIRHVVFVLAAALLSACGGKTDTTVAVTGVTVEPSQVTLLLDQTVQLIATVTPENATAAEVEWVTDNPMVAAVSPDGLVTAVSLGQTVVRAVVGDKSADCHVTVSPKVVESVSVSPSSLVLTVGDSQTLQASVMPEDATYTTVVWSSSDASVATVDQQGTVTVLAPGEVTITAEAVGGVKGQCALQCKAPFSFSVEYEAAEGDWKPVAEAIVGYPGREVALRLAIVEGEGKTFTWTVADDTHAGYSDGKLTLKTVGATSVTVEASDGQKQTFNVESRLSDGFLWGTDRFDADSMMPIGNSTEQIISVTWNDGQKEIALPVGAYGIFTESELIEITAVSEGYKVRSLGVQGDASISLKVGDYFESELCTVRVSGKWSSGNESLDPESTFPW